MPFTPTHIVAVLPFWPLRRVAPFSAFAIGAMIPDLPLFFPIVNYAQAHSLLGLFSICLPLGMGGFFLFELVLRKPMIALLPVWFASRLPSKPNILKQTLLGSQLIGVALAILVGAGTHQIWDAFTHKGRWGTQLIPMLNSSIEMGGLHVPGYNALQHGSTFIGLPLLALLAAIELSRRVPRLHQGTLPVKWKLLAGALIFIVPICVAVHTYMVSPNVHQALFLTITRSGAILMGMLFAYCSMFHVLTD
ncbi:DUF4184 family protein [Leptolyngbya cf. ectocarpi LEGE 11479]|uniref:DUF4184 family protein n=1 Tax=Leptolyngbya cf. ectocarpi LEGE 11479 TaxID=1828722 RepID=A0A928ZUC7_LEPEC|nr:DUF4184 family protein [Leptolyngbya ectocarpi]MBE9067622.1 DUF4184 family protein [Leptolyngbya cf. ectocarpi LEGE 11479]